MAGQANENIEITLKQLYDEVINSKEEVKCTIAASETRLLLELQSLKKRVEYLESENKSLKEKLDTLECANKKNNIILFGIDADYEKITPKFICEEISRTLKIRLDETEINDCYKLGKKEKAPIKVELISYKKKKEIFSHKKSLKGSKLFISNDWTQKQREEYNFLKTCLVQAKANTNEKSYIQGNRLKIGNEIYTVEELQKTQPKLKLRNKPPTSVTINQGDLTSEPEEELTEESTNEDGNTAEEFGEGSIGKQRVIDPTSEGTSQLKMKNKIFKKDHKQKTGKIGLRPRQGTTMN